MPNPNELQALANLHAQRRPMGPPLSAKPPTEADILRQQETEKFHREQRDYATLKELNSRESQLTAQIAELQTALKAIRAHRMSLEKDLYPAEQEAVPTTTTK